MSKKYYTQNHEWIEKKGDTYRCGITLHATELLSDLVYIELPKVGDTLTQNQVAGVLESVKTAADLYMPIGGEVESINQMAIEKPEIINESPEENGWLFEIKANNIDELEALMNQADYQTHIQNNA